MKTFGQINYEAYAERFGWKSAVSGAPLPQWADQDEKIQEGWSASAWRVINAYLDEIGERGSVVIHATPDDHHRATGHLVHSTCQQCTWTSEQLPTGAQGGGKTSLDEQIRLERLSHHRPPEET